MLLQGGQQNLTMWDEQMHPFSREFRVVRYDAGGFGRLNGEEWAVRVTR